MTTIKIMISLRVGILFLILGLWRISDVYGFSPSMKGRPIIAPVLTTTKFSVGQRSGLMALHFIRSDTSTTMSSSSSSNATTAVVTSIGHVEQHERQHQYQQQDSILESAVFSSSTAKKTDEKSSFAWLRKRHDDNDGGANRPMIVEIKSLIDWKELLDQGDDDDDDTDDDIIHDDSVDSQVKPLVTAVTFTASWCKFCQKFQLKWKRQVTMMNMKMTKRQRLAWRGSNEKKKKDDNSSASDIRFASVDFGTNKQLCRSLSIRALPTVQFYYKGALIDSFPCGPKSFAIAKESLQQYSSMSSEELDGQVQAWAVKHAQKCGIQTKDDTSSSNKYDDDTVEMTIANESEDGNDDNDDDDDDDAHDDDDDDDDYVEPSLFLRKRDRLKQKLGAGLRSLRVDE